MHWLRVLAMQEGRYISRSRELPRISSAWSEDDFSAHWLRSPLPYLLFAVVGGHFGGDMWDGVFGDLTVLL